MEIYFRCASCGELAGPRANPPNPALTCCARPSPERWPSVDALRLLDVAKEQLLDRKDGRRVAAVFLAFALERLIEDAVSPLRRTGDRLNGRRELLELFEARTNRRIGDVLREANLPAFWREWNELGRLRNQIAHGKYSVERTMDGSALRSLHGQALKAAFAVARAARAAAKGRPRGTPTQTRART